MSECKCKELASVVDELIGRLLDAQTSGSRDDDSHYTIASDEDNEFHELQARAQELQS